MLIKNIFLIYAVASLITAVLFFIDKSFARNQSQRIPENTLLMASLLCGWPGGLAAMHFARHKTKKSSFIISMAFAILMNVAIVFYLYRNYFSYGQ